jgi:hypothetical protein
MSRLMQVWRQLRLGSRRAELERGLEEEIRFHIEPRIAGSVYTTSVCPWMEGGCPRRKPSYMQHDFFGGAVWL